MCKHFPADAKSRRTIIIGEGPLRAPASGFPNAPDADAFHEGRYVLRAQLPRARARVDGYPVLGASAAYRILRHTVGHGAVTQGRLVIRAVRLGRDTDRGRRRLRAWQFYFAGRRPLPG